MIKKNWRWVFSFLCLLSLLVYFHLPSTSCAEISNELYGFDVTPRHIQYSNMAPGDSVEQVVTVTNDGYSPIAYDMDVYDAEDSGDISLFI